MTYRLFIQANNRQLLGALLSKYSIERTASKPIEVTILNVNEIPAFTNFEGVKFKHGVDIRTYSIEDGQSFTLSRFMPPELVGFTGKVVVIDPDVFAVQDMTGLFDVELSDAAIASCKKTGGDKWDTSVMLLDASKLTWKISEILAKLKSFEMTYNTVMRRLWNDPKVVELSREWNTLDEIRPTTKMIHYTNQNTQPWKTGLPIDFYSKGDTQRFFGIIPKRFLRRLVRPAARTYQPHPDEKAAAFFFSLVRDALKNGVITRDMIDEQVRSGYLRSDIARLIA